MEKELFERMYNDAVQINEIENISVITDIKRGLGINGVDYRVFREKFRSRSTDSTKECSFCLKDDYLEVTMRETYDSNNTKTYVTKTLVPYCSIVGIEVECTPIFNG